VHSQEKEAEITDLSGRHEGCWRFEMNDPFVDDLEEIFIMMVMKTGKEFLLERLGIGCMAAASSMVGTIDSRWYDQTHLGRMTEWAIVLDTLPRLCYLHW